MILPSKFNVKLQKKLGGGGTTTLPPPYGHVWVFPISKPVFSGPQAKIAMEVK
jgi:hypothetical protein